ncbi:MAG: hypothetical protein IKZ38_00840, partial [Clostridia bacterium]|nr:hypothetical protein [Clostridia bacterium]
VNTNRLFNMPILYDEIRKYAIEQNWYTSLSEGMYCSNVENIAEKVANLNYHNNIDVIKIDALTTAIGYVIQEKAVILGMNGSTSYNNHAVVLIGYRLYEYTEGWWIFANTYNAYFLEIADGWANNSRYLDLNTGSNIFMELYSIL